ncbi:MAG: hypothetical protein H6737_25260 [Alphaproteobacteria bacterium]|nr:hypothetical protein [Alphaproteobacteria bacterium]
MIRALPARLLRQTGPVERVAVAVLLAVLLVGLVVAPFTTSPVTELRGLSAWAPLGRDHLGRNVLARLVGGAGSAAVPFVWAWGVTALGVVACAACSWAGGLVRAAFGAVTGVLGAIPRFVWVLLALSVYGRSFAVLGVAAGLAFLPSAAAVVDARIAPWRTDPSVQADLAHGVPRRAVLWERLLLWECGPDLLRQTLGLFGFVVVLEATLAYLGFAVGEPWPSWGNAVVFDWGRSDVTAVARLAPLVTLWAAAWLATVASGPREQP